MTVASSDVRVDHGWAAVRTAPTAQLAPSVRTITGWREVAPTKVGRWERPQAGMSIILSFGPDLRVGASTSGPVTTVRSFVVGLHDRASWTEHDGVGHGVQLDLTPAGAYALVGTAVPELRNGVHPTGDACRLPVDRIVDRLLDASDTRARLGIVHDELTAAVAAGPGLSSEVAWAERQLRATGGTVRIGALCDELGWSRRRLVERFTREVGATPKAFARLVRFRHAHDRLVATPGAALATLAADCGYADQSHFTREFRTFAGCTPTEVLAEVRGAAAI